MARYRPFTAAMVVFHAAVVICFAGIVMDGAAAAEPSFSSTDTSFLAIDMIDVTLPDARGVEPSPFILWRNTFDARYLVRIMTLRSYSGGQLGDRLDVLLPLGEPAAILWSSAIPVFPGRGVEPSPFIVFRDFRIYAFPVLFGFDGTPSAGALYTQQIEVDPMPDEHATCLAEMPGSLFLDGLPRLFIGTDMGNVVVITYETGVGFLKSDLLPISEDPIRDIGLIPQYGHVMLGSLVGGSIYGHVYEPPAADQSKASRSWQQFVLTDSRLATATDFAVFGIADQSLTNPDTTVRIIIADGSDQLGLAGIGAQLSGSTPLAIADELAARPVLRITAGTYTLLMLSSDSAGVYFDPYYIADSGSAGCEVNITDDIMELCGYTCGDANADLAINVADAVFLISYIFKGGPAPDPLCVGDANADDAVNIADAVYLINYIFKSGPAPSEACCP